MAVSVASQARRHWRTYARWVSVILLVVLGSYVAFRCVDPPAPGAASLGGKHLRAPKKAAAYDASAHYIPGDTNPDPQPIEQDKSTTPVYVTDEHHHVLPLWFAELHERNLSGVTLVHVDAHSDLANPQDFATLIQRPPFTRHSVRTENDEFIAAAMWAGLVDRFVWVIPYWAWDYETGRIFNRNAIQDRHIHPGRNEIHIGPLIEDEPNPEDEELVCVCTVVIDEDGEPYGDCDLVPEVDDIDLDDFGYEDCDIQRRIPIQVVSSDQLFKDGTITAAPGEAEKPILLDVDEDFFCTDDIVGTYRSFGWRNKTLSMVDDALMTFCAADEHAESELAALLEAAILGAPPSRDAALNQANKRFVCPGLDVTWKTALEQLAAAVGVATELGQRKAADMRQGLVNVGICTRPDAETWPVEMAVCAGKGNGLKEAGDPEDRIYEPNYSVIFHRPSAAELAETLSLFDKWLATSGIKEFVEFVTVCRSTRDGYLPRDLLDQVESSVLASLDRHLPAVTVRAEGARKWGKLSP